MKILLSLSLILYSSYTVSGLNASPEDMLTLAESVVLAKHINSEEKQEKRIFHFNTIQRIKGDAPERFVIEFKKHPYDEYIERHVDHKSYEFWIFGRDRTNFFTDQHIFPTFEKDKEYLLFLSDKPSLRSYEEITDKNDAWYQHILDLSKKQKGEDVKIKPIMTKKALIDQFENINLYKCPDKKTNQREMVFVELIKGEKVRQEIAYPNFGKKLTCGGTGLKFIYMSSKGKIPLAVPVVDNQVDFSYLLSTNLVPNNKIGLDYLRSEHSESDYEDKN